MKRKITATILTITALCSLCTACGKNEQTTNETTTAPTVAAVATTEPQSTEITSAAPETTANAQNPEPTTANTQSVTSQPSTQSQQTAQAQNQTGMSVNEIVELYNSSANRIKNEASSITRNYKKLSSVDEYLQLPSAIQSLGKTAMKQFVKGSDTPESWSSKEDIQLVFPVGGTDYTSHLTADMVKNATCTDNGSTYQIEINLFDDKITSPAKGEGYAGVFNTVTASTFDEINIPTVTFNKVAVNGINGSISCTIDKTSKKITDITFRNTDILALNVKVVVSSIDAQIALAVEENYTVTY